jgi:hypothetical protein
MFNFAIFRLEFEDCCKRVHLCSSFVVGRKLGNSGLLAVRMGTRQTTTDQRPTTSRAELRLTSRILHLTLEGWLVVGRKRVDGGWFMVDGNSMND